MRCSTTGQVVGSPGEDPGGAASAAGRVSGPRARSSAFLGVEAATVDAPSPTDRTSQIAQRIECTGYSENDGPFSPDEPSGTLAVGGCNIAYKYPDSTAHAAHIPVARVRRGSTQVMGKRERERLDCMGRQRAARVRVA